MADNEYKIELGVELKTDDIKSQINAVERSLDPIKIQIDTETKDLVNKIESAFKAINNSSKNTLTLNTAGLEKSLERVELTITDIKKSLGTFDTKSGMKSLLSSVNQITSALSKAEKESDSLVKSLSALSKKDFSFNFNVKAGNANPVKSMSDYGDEVRNNVIPELEKRVQYFRKALGGFENAKSELSKLMTSKYGITGATRAQNLIDSLGDDSSLSKQMNAYKRYLEYMQEIAFAKNRLLKNDYNYQFSIPTEDLIKSAKEIQAGTKDVEDSFDKLKQVFNTGIDAEGLSVKLQPIVDDLGAIRKAIDGLSKNTSFTNLTSSFNRLSKALENVMDNANAAQQVLKDGFGISTSSGNAIKTAQQTGQKLGNVLEKTLEQSLDIDDAIDKQVLDLMNKYGIVGKKGSKAFEEIKQAVVSYRNELLTTDGVDDNVFSNVSSVRQVTSALANNMKVADETKEVYTDLIQYIKEFNNSGRKIHIMDSIKQEYGDDFSSMRSSLGRAFTTKGEGLDFDIFIDELNENLGNIIDTSNGIEAAYGDLVDKVRKGRDNKPLSGDDLFRQGILNIDDVEKDISSAISNIDQAISDKQIAQLKEIGFDTSNFDKVESDLNNVKNRIEEVTRAAEENRQALDNIYSEAAEGMQNAGVDPTPENFENLKGTLTEKYESNIAALEEEKAELQSRLPILEETYNREKQLLTESYQQIQKNAEQRKLEAQQAQEAAQELSKLQKYYRKYDSDSSDWANDKKVEVQKNQIIKQLTEPYDEAKGIIRKIGTFTDSSGISQKELDYFSAMNAELKKLGYTLGEIKWNGKDYIASADIIPIDENAVTNAEEMRKILFDLESQEEKIAQTSTQTANIIEKNAEKQEQSYKEVADVVERTVKKYEKISRDTSLVRDNATFRQVFGTSNQEAQEAQKHFQELLADEKAVVTVTEQFDDSNALQSFVVNIKRASGEVETLRYAMEDLSQYSGIENDWHLAYQGASANDKSVEKQLDKHIKKANDLQTKLDKIKSNYSDVNAAKPIKDSNHISALSNQYDKVVAAIENVKKADNSTFSSMVSNAQKEIAVLESMTSEFRNAESVATSLRSKDIDTVKSTYDSKLDVLISKMRKDGVYTSGFEKGAENLRSVLSNATDKDGLISFLNGLDKLEAGYKRASASAKEFNQSQRVGINTSGLESKIANLQRISPEIDKFETEINGAKVSVQSLLKDLGQIKTQGDFSVVNAKFKTFADAAEAAGIAVTESSNNTAFKKAQSTIKEIKSEMNDFIKLQKQIGNMRIQIKTLETQGGNVDSITNFKERLIELENTYERSMKTFSKKLFDNADIIPFDEVTKFNDEIMSISQNNENQIKGLDIKADFEKLKSLAKEISNLRIDILKSDDTFDISKATVELGKLNNEYDELFAKTKGSLDNRQLSQLGNLVDQGDAQVLREFNNELNELVKLQNHIENTRFEIGKLEVVGDKNNEIETLKRQLKELEDIHNRLNHRFMEKAFANGDFFGVNDFSELENGIANATKNAENRLERFKSQYADARAELAKKIKVDIDVGNFDDDLSRMYEGLNKLSFKSEDLENNIEAVKNALKAMKEASIANEDGVLDTERLIKAQEQYNEALEKTNNLIKIQSRAERKVNEKEKLDDDIKLFQSNIDSWLTKNSAATERFGERMLGLKAQAEGVDRVKLNGLIRQFKLLDKEADTAGLKMLSLGDQIKTKFKEYSAYFSVAEVFMYVTQGLKDMFNQVVAIDTAMTELRKVTNETEASYNYFLSNAASKAKELGTTIDGLVNSTADFARLGYGFEDAQGLAEVANIYAVVGDDIDSVETATQSLISTLTAFKDEANGLSDSDFAMSIVDKMNEVANNYAISSGGIGDALQRSASSMMAANNSLDETIALITAANTVVQDPDAVGTAFKTISMRIRGAKTELEEAGLETDGMADSTAKLRQEIMALSGVDIMLNAKEFKSTYQIMEELADKWQDLSDIQQASVTELIAGKRQGNIVSSLMNNFDIAQNALETSLNSSGSAMKEHAKYMDSLEARMSQLKAAWQGLSQTFMNSDFLKTGISFITELVSLLDKLIDKFGTLGTIGFGASIFGLFKLRGTGAKSSILDAFSFFGSVVSDAISSSGKLSSKFKDVGAAASMAGGQIGKTLTSSLSGWVTGIGIAVAAAGLLYSVYKNIKEEAAKARQETIESSETYLDASSNFEQAYIKYSGKSELTTDEETELAAAIKGTTDALGDKSSELHNVVNSSNDYLASLEQIAEKEREIAKEKAKEKKEALEENLTEAAIGYEKFDGSEVNVSLGTSGLGNLDETDKIIKEVAGKYFKQTQQGVNGAKFNLALDTNADTSEILDYYYTLLDIEKELKDAGLDDTSEYENVTAAIGKMTEAVDAYANGVYDAVKAQQEIPTTVDQYLEMRKAILSDDEVKDLSIDTRKSFANTLDAEYGEFFDLTTAEVQSKKLIGILDEFGETEASQVETFLNMRTAVNSNECTVGEYLSELNKINTIDGDWSKESQKEFTTSFVLDTDKVKKQYDDAYKYISRNYLDKLNTGSMPAFEIEEYKRLETQRIQDLLNGLSASELAAVVSIKSEINWESSTDELRKQIEDEAKFIEAMNFTIAIDVETESIETLNTAMAESVSSAGLSSESIASLKSRYAELEDEGYNLSAMFEETANGIHLNRKAVSELEQKLASNKLAETDKQLKVLKGRYDELTTEIDKCRDAGDRAALYTEQQSIVDKINDLATLASQYEGLTSAYNAWQSAESAGSERDMYESIIEGFETVGDEIKRGWVDDGTIKFLELLTGKTDLASKSGKQLKEIYDSLDDTIKYKDKNGKVVENTGYSISDFFTVDEDGNSTNAGVYNFLDAIGKLEEEAFGGLDVVKRDGEGNIIGFDFELVAKKDENGNVIKNGDQVIAEALGISEELVQIMVRASDDAGFVVNLEGAYTQLADLKTEAETARDTLISLQSKGLKELKGVDVNFNLDAEGNDLVIEQEKAVKLLDKFKKDGKIDLKMEGAQQALDIAEYLTIKLDDLTEPRYMQIDATQVEEDIREPLKDMQEFEKLSKEKHLLQLTGDKEKIKEVQDDMDEIANGLEDLDKETKVKLGIDGLTSEEIFDKLEKGEIEIPAELNLDVQMSDDLKDIRLLMMDNLGLTSDGEVELKIKYGIDDSTVDEIIKDEKQTVVLEYITENEEEFNKLTDEEKEVVVKLIADGVDLDNYEVEDKEAIVNYIANGEEADGWTPEAKDAFVKYLADGGEIDKFDPKNKESWVVYDTDTTEPDSYEADDENATVVFDKDSSEPDGYVPDDPNATVIFDKDTSAIDSWKPVVTGIAKFTLSMIIPQGIRSALSAIGISIANGTANAEGSAFVNGTSGRAFSQGNWRTKKSQTALTGELGREIVVTPNNNWYTVGDSGAEFVNIPRGSIVFNHRQTEELLKNGKTTSGGGRAKALVSGTAFSSGSGGIGRYIMPIPADSGGTKKTTTTKKEETTTTTKTTTTTSTTGGSSGSGGVGKVSGSKSVGSNGSSSSSSSGSSSSNSKDFEETFDWVEVAIDRVERAIDQLDQKANNVYKSWSSRNEALTSEISKIKDEIGLQQQAYDKYMSVANAVGLSSSWAEKVRNGAIDISTVKDEKLAEKIKEYQDWYNKALDCKDAILELQETEAKLYVQRVENVSAQYEGILGVIEHEKNMIEEYISQSEANAQFVSKNYYNALKDNEEQTISELENQREEMLKAFNTAMDSGTITKNSEAYFNMVNSIDEVTLAIQESQTAIDEYNQTLQQLNWEIFDTIQDRISNVTDEADFLIELMSNGKLFEDDGQLTAKGKSTMGLHGQNYNAYMYQADAYKEEVYGKGGLNDQIATDPYDQDLINRRNELLELQREMILNAEQEKEAIRNLVEEGIDYELEALQEKIDLYNEELNSQKDLYDYQKKVKEQTEDIASLEKQIAAYSGDNSEEARAKVQELKISLKDAKSGLEDSERDWDISSQQKLLDELYDDYELTLNTRLDNLDALVEQMIAEINADAGIISETISEVVGNVNYELSESMSAIWDKNAIETNNVIASYGDKIEFAQTTTNGALTLINNNLLEVIGKLDSKATTNTKKATTSSSSKSTTKKTNTTTTKKSASSGDGTPKVGDKVKFVSGQYYYDSYGVKPLGSQKQGQYVYITNINKKGSHPYHISTGTKLGSGDLGWLKLNQISGYATGKQNFIKDEIAWTQENGREFIVRPSDGAILTPVAKGDSVLTSAASNNIWDMANSPADFIKENLTLDAANVPNNSNVNNSIVQNFENITFSMPNVHGYNDLLTEMQRDPKFEKLILSMTVDQIAGKSKLAKGKSIR